MAADNVVLNKTATMERCIRRVLEEYQGFEIEFSNNFTKQDSVILNLERLCQAAIDLAAYLVRINKFGIPQDNRELFRLLEQNSFISSQLSKKLQAMVGFRNLAVHDYQELNLDIVQGIIKNNLIDFQEFSKIALRSQKQ
jgi:uncharacterized protein YutE (UPF0331/DUF86 family)